MQPNFGKIEKMNKKKTVFTCTLCIMDLEFNFLIYPIVM